MKVIFISKVHKDKQPGIVVANQIASIKKYTNTEIIYYGIEGRGIWKYFRTVPNLYRFLKNNPHDVVHANYSFCGFTAAMALASPLVVSLMGSDTKTKGLLKLVTKFCIKVVWKKTIVKSSSMGEDLNSFNSVDVIPNGVDISLFECTDQEQARKKLNFDSSKKHIVFIGDPARYSKNGQLAKRSVDSLNRSDVQFHIANGIPHSEIINYMHASDMILMTSRYEGSPNVIKEAMACNKPIVSTNVGDVEYLLDGLAGCFVTSHLELDITSAISKCLDFSAAYKNTKGKEKLIALGIDAKSTADKIVSVYEQTIK